MKDALRVIFMGTPEFAVSSLQKLVENDVHIVAVITAPDKPKGRGKQINSSPVKDYAQAQGLAILQPTNLKDASFQQQLRNLNADLQIVVAFRMLPEAVWNMPPIGTFNLHASLLPQYRGAAPIHWAIINGEQETGVTTFFLKHEIDTGKIIFQEKETIFEDDTVGTLYDRLMHKGADLVLKTVRSIQDGNYPQAEQQEIKDLKPAPKIFKETCQIDWHQSSKQIRNFVRGLNPFPTAWTTFNNKNCKIFLVEPSLREVAGNIGDWESDNKTYLSFKTADGAVDVLELQMEGKKRMKIEDFLRGNTL